MLLPLLTYSNHTQVTKHQHVSVITLMLEVWLHLLVRNILNGI